MKLATPNESEDFMARFDFEDQGLEYIDAPILGWLRAQETGERFAFHCRQLIPGLLWHWVLVPAVSDLDPELTITRADADSCPEWISVVEDRRHGRPKCLVARIHFKAAKPPF